MKKNYIEPSAMVVNLVIENVLQTVSQVIPVDNDTTLDSDAGVGAKEIDYSFDLVDVE